MYLRRRRKENSYLTELGLDPVSSAPSPSESLLQQETATLVRQIIIQLRKERDRQMLLRFFIAEQSKEQICADLGLTSRQFNQILWRALKRFETMYVEKDGTVTCSMCNEKQVQTA